MRASQAFREFDLVVNLVDGEKVTVRLVDTETQEPQAEGEFSWSDLSGPLDLLIGLETAIQKRNVVQRHQLNEQLGRALFPLAFPNAVGGAFEAIRRSEPVKLRLRFDDPALMRFPWELLHDGEDFLVSSPRCLLSRLPQGAPQLRDPGPVRGKLRMLIVISNPLDLPEEKRLFVEEELDRIIQALDGPISRDLIEVEWEDEANLSNLEELLQEGEYHIVHYTGHGHFDPESQRGGLLLENDRGNSKVEDNEAITTLLANHPTLRLVMLAGCQTAQTSIGLAFSDLARPLLRRNIPAVVAMQWSVTDIAATKFARRFYDLVGQQRPVDEAVALARGVLRSSETPDEFATPVLFASRPDCLRVEPGEEEAPTIDLSRSLPLEQLGHRFIGRRRELRTLKRDFFVRGVRWVVIHGFGGIGKTVTATQAVLCFRRRFDLVYGVDCRGGLSADELLAELDAFLQLNRRPGLGEHRTSPVPLKVKVTHMAQLLGQHRLLLILDNFESLLDDDAQRPQDADFHLLLRNLVIHGGDRLKLLITSRYDFDLLEGRATTFLHSINLAEFSRPEALMHMNRLPELAEQDLETKLRIHEVLGGHPYALNVLSRHCGAQLLGPLLDDLGGVAQELREFTLFDRTLERLPPPARELLARAWVYRKPVSVEALQWMMGNDDERFPGVENELEELIHWSLLAKVPTREGERYHIHTLVREFMEHRTDEEMRKWWRVRGAEFYEWWVREKSESAFDHLDARRLYLDAGEFIKAGEIVANVTESLHRWGFVDMVLKLNMETAENTTGGVKAGAEHHLGIILQGLGSYESAREHYQASLAIDEDLGDHDRAGIAASRHQLGTLAQAQGDYDAAREHYEASLAIAEELGDRANIAASRHQLGNLAYLQGDYDAAREHYEASLAIKEELGDRHGIAASRHQFGRLAQNQGDYDAAREHYEASLAILKELGDRAGIASTRHQLGWLAQNQGDYGVAREHCAASLAIFEKLGNRVSIAASRHQLGTLAQMQGDYEAAREHYEASLAIKEELGDRAGIASSRHQFGMLAQDQGNYDAAREHYAASLAIAEVLGDRRGIAQTHHQLGILAQDQGDYDAAREHCAASLAIKEELGDRAGIASTRHNLGALAQDQGDYDGAREHYAASLAIFEKLGDRAGIAASRHQLGMLAHDQGDYVAAREHYAASLAIDEELGNRRGIASSRHQFGMLAQAQGDYEAAREHYWRALAIFEELRAPEAEMARRDLARVEARLAERAGDDEE